MHLLDAARNGPVRGCPLGCGFLLFVPPSGAYLSYIDWNTLALLFSLMAVMRGLQKVGFFAYTANFLLKRITSTRTLLLILVFLPFFFSMVITNDVALITFVPFGLIVLKMAGQERLAVPQVVLQTVAANLGSMLTPVGNPQNLYLYNKSGIGFGELCGWMLPYVLASGVCLALIIVFRKPVRISGISLTAPLGEPGRSAMLYGRLCAVPSRNFQADPARYRCGCHCGLFAGERPGYVIQNRLFAACNVFCLFIFVGNVAGITAFQSFLTSILAGRVELVAVLTSQITSNVPAALLLSGFTTQWRSLIVGCNLGGLGTLIASMASLISYKMVVKEFPGQRKRYFGGLPCATSACFCFFLLCGIVWSILPPGCPVWPDTPPADGPFCPAFCFRFLLLAPYRWGSVRRIFLVFIFLPQFLKELFRINSSVGSAELDHRTQTRSARKRGAENGKRHGTPGQISRSDGVFHRSSRLDRGRAVLWYAMSNIQGGDHMEEQNVKLTKLASCAGCGAKVGAGVLAQLLEGLKVHRDPRLLVGFDKSDDASVYQISEDLALVQTVDFFPPIADDPYLFGQIAATNALSDVYAMGGEPKLALNLLCIPESMPKEAVHQLLRGGYDKVYEGRRHHHRGPQHPGPGAEVRPGGDRFCASGKMLTNSGRSPAMCCC